jgi:hypothetical protein
MLITVTRTTVSASAVGSSRAALPTSVYFRKGFTPLKSKEPSQKQAEERGAIIGGELGGGYLTNVRPEPLLTTE